jgi:hypothetical protein
MAPLAILVCTVGLLLAVLIDQRQETGAVTDVRPRVSAPLRVLFIGNSLTGVNDMPGLFRQFAASVGRQVQTEGNIQYGGSLEDQWRSGEALERLRRGGPWDIVVLQELSDRPVTDPASFLHFAGRFADAARAVRARPVIFENWPHLGATTAAELQWESASVAVKVGAELVPVGEAWVASMGTLGPGVLYADDRHPTAAGTYLAVCVLMASLLNTSPVGLPVTGLPLQGVPEPRVLQNYAWNTVNKDS